MLESRDNDIFGIGYARGVFSDSAASSFPSDYESVLEVYYDIRVNPNFVFGPSVQYITNPTDGQGTQNKDAMLVGLRGHLTF